MAVVEATGVGSIAAAINTFQWQNVLTILLAIVVFSEVVSAYLRRKVR